MASRRPMKAFRCVISRRHEKLKRVLASRSHRRNRPPPPAKPLSDHRAQISGDLLELIRLGDEPASSRHIVRQRSRLARGDD